MKAFQFSSEIGATVREEEWRPVPEKPQVGEPPLEHVPDEDPGGQGEWSDAERRQQHVCGRVIILSYFSHVSVHNHLLHKSMLLQ